MSSIREFKKQASFFLKEKIKTARLALTDVTPIQLLTEDATNGNPDVPEARTLKMISRAAFEIDDYWRIVEILHKRLMSFDRKAWRISYQALIVLDYLLTHGPERVAEEFESDKDAIKEAANLQYVDEKGFNWGVHVRRKSERILELLENRPLLKEERNKARTITRVIEGFGSFSDWRTSDQDPSSSLKPFSKCNSQFNEHGNEIPRSSSSKENQAPIMEKEADEWNDDAAESNSLLSSQETSSRTKARSSEEEDHPFSLNTNEQFNNVSLLSTDRVLRAF